MAKISELPELLAPSGEELVPVVDDAGVTRRASLSRLVAEAVAPAFTGRASLGDIMLRASVGAAAFGGAEAILNGLRFRDGNGNASFLVYAARADDVVREMLPRGTRCRLTSIFAVTAGTAAALGLPSDGYVTRIIRTTDGAGADHYEGAYDPVASGYRGATTLIRATTFDWYPEILQVGGIEQFGSVTAGYIGTYDVVLTAMVLAIDAVPASSAMTAADLVAAIERERIRRARAVTWTVGAGAADFPNLAAAAASLKDATEQTRQHLALQAFADTTQIAMPAFTDIVGLAPDLSIIRYTGAGNMTAATRVANDPVRGQSTNTLENISIVAREANYCLHRESGGNVRDGVARVVNCVLRHEGNEASYAASIAAGAEDRGLRWIPAVGWGMSPGEVGLISRTTATSLKGGGLYVHNSANQVRPCQLTVEDSFIGGDDPVAADFTITTLGSGTQDVVKLSNLQLSNGVIAYGVSGANPDPALCGADHADIRIIGRGLPPHIFAIGDGVGRALRVRGKGEGGFVIPGGPAADRILGTGYRGPILTLGEDGRRPSVHGWFDVQRHSLGSRLGDRRGAPEALTVNVSGVEKSYTFDQDMRGVSNAAIIATLADAFGAVATVDLLDVTSRYRPTIADQEAVLFNSGSYSIHLGTIVAYPFGGSSCRPAEESDFANGRQVDARMRFGVAMADIRRGSVGRVQVRGWIAFGSTLATVGAGLDEGFLPSVVDGIHGVPTYAGSGGPLLRCIRTPRNDGQGRESPRILLVA